MPGGIEGAVAAAVIQALLPFAEELGKETIESFAIFAEHMHALGVSRPGFLVTVQLMQKEADHQTHSDGTPLPGWEKQLWVVEQVHKIWGAQLLRDTGNSFIFTMNSLIHMPVAQEAAAAAGNIVAKSLSEKISAALTKWLPH